MIADEASASEETLTQAAPVAPRVEVAIPESMLLRAAGIVDTAASCKRFVEYRVPAHIDKATIPIDDLLSALWPLLCSVDSRMRATPPPGLEDAVKLDGFRAEDFRAGIDVAAVHGDIRALVVGTFQRLMLDTVIVRREEAMMFEKRNVFAEHPRGRYSCCPTCKASDGSPAPRADGCPNADCHDDSLVTCEPLDAGAPRAPCGFVHTKPESLIKRLYQQDFPDTWKCGVVYTYPGTNVVACESAHEFGKRNQTEASASSTSVTGKVS